MKIAFFGACSVIYWVQLMLSEIYRIPAYSKKYIPSQGRLVVSKSKRVFTWHKIKVYSNSSVSNSILIFLWLYVMSSRVGFPRSHNSPSLRTELNHTWELGCESTHNKLSFQHQFITDIFWMLIAIQTSVVWVFYVLISLAMFCKPSRMNWVCCWRLHSVFKISDTAFSQTITFGMI